MVHLGIQGFDLTTAGNLFLPHRAFAVAGELNARASTADQVGLELYATRSTPLAQVNARHVREWAARFGAPVRRVHLEFVADTAELRHVLRSVRNRAGPARAAIVAAMYALLPDAAGGRATQLAVALRVGVNVHANVLVRLLATGALARLARHVPFVLAENNIRAEYLYARGPITYDPRTIVDELVGRAGISGLMLGLDHLVDHYASQRIDPRELLDDPRIQRSTVAVHIAGQGHAPLRPGDPRHAALLRKLTATPFANPVRLAFDYTPIGMLRYSEREQVRLLEQTMRWIRDLQR